MSITKTFLGLLEDGPSYGYDLKREYDARFGFERPVAYGQVYATLSRLLKGGLVTVDAVEPGDGPDRKRYAITEDGVADVQAWLAQPEKPDLYLHSVLYAKVVLALRSGRSATEILDAQRAEHLRHMRELTRRKQSGELADQLVCDHALFHLEADLRSGRSATEILDAQRAEHLRHMRELTRRKQSGELADQLVCDHALFHLEADLRWLELTAARLDQLAAAVVTA